MIDSEHGAESEHSGAAVKDASYWHARPMSGVDSVACQAQAPDDPGNLFDAYCVLTGHYLRRAISLDDLQTCNLLPTRGLWLVVDNIGVRHR